MLYQLNKELISKRMEELGVGKTALMSLTGLTFAAISSAVLGGRTRFETAWKIAEVLDVDVTELTGKKLTLGTNLMAHRLSRRVSREDLAERIGLPISAVADWENDRCFPSLWNAYYASSFLGYTINECFGLDVDFANKGAVT
jgi:transcriptional regulator with XRE-family HTH domain